VGELAVPNQKRYGKQHPSGAAIFTYASVSKPSGKMDPRTEVVFEVDRGELTRLSAIDRATEAQLKAKYPHFGQWWCCGDHCEAKATIGRLKYWITCEPDGEQIRATIGIGEWRMAQAHGENPLQAIERARLRMAQFLKDFDTLFSGSEPASTPEIDN
jgi:hypothetical protein